MLGLIITLEALIGREDILRDGEAMRRGIERPEVGTKNHDAEIDVHVVMSHSHSLLEVVGQVLAKAHI